MHSLIKRPFFVDEIFYVPAKTFTKSCDHGSEVVDTDQEFRVSIDMPGVKANDLKVALDNAILSIEGVRKMVDGQGSVIKKSRVTRSFAIDTDTVDTSSLKANVSDGVLTITAQKKKKPAPLQIKVTYNTEETLEQGTEIKEKEADDVSEKKTDTIDQSDKKE